MNDIGTLLLIISFFIFLFFISLITYWIIDYLQKLKWEKIEKLNEGLNISRELCFIDKRRYLRWKKNDKLCHRDIAWENNIRHSKLNFGNCDIHHKDKNKLNNQPWNLDILSREEHQIEHNLIIYENNKKYIRLVKSNVYRKETKKAILIGGKHGQWYPKSQLIEKNGYLYCIEWLYNKKKG